MIGHLKDKGSQLLQALYDTLYKVETVSNYGNDNRSFSRFFTSTRKQTSSGNIPVPHFRDPTTPHPHGAVHFLHANMRAIPQRARTPPFPRATPRRPHIATAGVRAAHASHGRAFRAPALPRRGGQRLAQPALEGSRGAIRAILGQGDVARVAERAAGQLAHGATEG